MTPDSSALIAAFAPWHELHDLARRALRGVGDLVAHVELETYSVLTALPPPHRAERELVARYLRARHPGGRLVLPKGPRFELVAQLAGIGIAGAAVHDAIVAATAAHHDRELVSCDSRAAEVYARVGAAVTMLA